jgi:hypothetical protein
MHEIIITNEALPVNEQNVFPDLLKSTTDSCWNQQLSDEVYQWFKGVENGQ